MAHYSRVITRYGRHFTSTYARQIQQGARGFIGRRKAVAVREEIRQERASVKIQAVWRGLQGRRMATLARKASGENEVRRTDTRVQGSLVRDSGIPNLILERGQYDTCVKSTFPSNNSWYFAPKVV